MEILLAYIICLVGGFIFGVAFTIDYYESKGQK